MYIGQMLEVGNERKPTSLHPFCLALEEVTPLLFVKEASTWMQGLLQND